MQYIIEIVNWRGSDKNHYFVAWHSHQPIIGEDINEAAVFCRENEAVMILGDLENNYPMFDVRIARINISIAEYPDYG
jgi:hypothetical protein